MFVENAVAMFTQNVAAMFKKNAVAMFYAMCFHWGNIGVEMTMAS